MLIKNFTTLLLFTFFTQLTFSQQVEFPVRYYLSTPDYVANKLHDEEAFLVVKDTGENFIHAKMLRDPWSTKRSKTAEAAWAIVHGDELYINMRYLYLAGNANFFIKPQIVGHYILIVLDREILKYYNKTRGNPYIGAAGGLTAVAMNETAMSGANFEDSNGDKKKIVFINRDLSTVVYKKNKYSQAMLLDKSTMVELLAKNKIVRKPKDFTYEEIISLINELNLRYE